MPGDWKSFVFLRFRIAKTTLFCLGRVIPPRLACLSAPEDYIIGSISLSFLPSLAKETYLGLARLLDEGYGVLVMQCLGGDMIAFGNSFSRGLNPCSEDSLEMERPFGRGLFERLVALRELSWRNSELNFWFPKCNFIYYR